MDFDDLGSFRLAQQRLIEALETHAPLVPRDWLRVLAATEVAFASYVLGSAGDWRICTGLSDEETLPLLRGLQRKLIRTTAVLRHGSRPGSGGRRE
jgi:hypothetical protein